MKFPKSKPVGSPTPYDKLIICDKCQVAEWTMRAVGVVEYCRCRTRKREASDLEYALAQ